VTERVAAPTEHEHEHEHRHEQEAAPGRWGVWVMGLVGGLVPSPSALLLLLAAVALGRAWFGFVLVLAFGIGMAASLAAVGLLARDVVLRFEGMALRRGFLGGQVRTYLRYGAALGICAVGTGVVVRTLLQL
jgi:nickel/cobalt exporter